MIISEMKEKIVFKLDHRGADLEASAEIEIKGVHEKKQPKKINFYNNFYIVMAERNKN